MPQHNTKIKVEKGYNVYENVYKETTKNLSATRHLLFIWGGSCYKLIWHHILCWIFVYSLLSLMYRYVIYDYPRQRQNLLKSFEPCCF